MNIHQILTEAYSTFRTHPYSSVELQNYANRVISRGLPETWVAEGMHPAIVLTHNLAQRVPASQALPRKHCCAEFTTLCVAFEHNEDPETRHHILQTGETWFTHHTNCGNYQSNKVTFNSFVEIENRRTREREEALRRRRRQEEEKARLRKQAEEAAARAAAEEQARKEAEERARREAEEERKRQRRLAAQRRLAKRKQQQRERTADEFSERIIAAAKARESVVHLYVGRKPIRIVLAPPCLPAQALIDAINQIGKTELDSDDKTVICNRLIESANASLWA